jgi:hypothetical protein
MRRTSNEETLRLASDAVEHQAGALAWVKGPLKAFLDTLGETGIQLPDAATRKLGLSPGQPCLGEHSLLLALFLAETVERLGLSADEGTRLPVEAAIEAFDRHIVEEIRRVTLSEEDMETARTAEALVTWTGHPFHVNARFRLGRLSFTAHFQSKGRDAWERHWMPDTDTRKSLEAWGVDERGGAGHRPTGLFPAIDRALRDITEGFLDRYNPDKLLVSGRDGKRNGHNAATYGSILPEEYGLCRHKGRGDYRRASADGVVAVEFLRLPEAKPAFPVPLEPGTVYGHGGVPLPSVRDQREELANPDQIGMRF